MELKKYCEITFIRPDDIEDAQEFAGMYCEYYSETELNKIIEKEYKNIIKESQERIEFLNKKSKNNDNIEIPRIEYRITNMSADEYIEMLEKHHKAQVLMEYRKKNKQYREYKMEVMRRKSIEDFTKEDYEFLNNIEKEEYVMALKNDHENYVESVLKKIVDFEKITMKEFYDYVDEISKLDGDARLVKFAEIQKKYKKKK